VNTGGRDAEFSSTVGAPPTVNLRYPVALLIWPVVFTTFLFVFLGSVIVRGPTGDSSRTANVGGIVLVATLFMIAPAGVLCAQARSSVRSAGTDLRIRAGFISRTIPAADIVAIVKVDRVGRRVDLLQRGRGFNVERPAIMLRPGSASDRIYTGEDRGAMLHWLFGVAKVLTNRWGTDMPLMCLPPTMITSRRTDRALRQLEAWHRWALSDRGSPLR
jgi:hypothetical protein